MVSTQDRQPPQDEPAFNGQQSIGQYSPTPQANKQQSNWGFRDKTVWDLLQLIGVLAIPIAVALIPIFYNLQQVAITQANRQNDIQIAQDQQQETAMPY